MSFPESHIPVILLLNVVLYLVAASPFQSVGDLYEYQSVIGHFRPNFSNDPLATGIDLNPATWDRITQSLCLVAAQHIPSKTDVLTNSVGEYS